ncbi:MAG: glutamate-5-semialdehyde dehydrogenase, partial [Actinomycetota bacterium]|nr:glutamate-5-semialdehyde dehydrogenase [Actinomycetota bacterium]
MREQINRLEEGQLVLTGGGEGVRVSAELATAFVAGDQLLISDDSLLRVPQAEAKMVSAAIEAADDAFSDLAQCSDEAISSFFRSFGFALTSTDVREQILAANAIDVADAQRRGRSTTRLEVTQKMLDDMVEGLNMWSEIGMRRDETVDMVHHAG